jgi:serine/threonine protein phosphatase PrpC
VINPVSITPTPLSTYPD